MQAVGSSACETLDARSPAATCLACACWGGQGGWHRRGASRRGVVGLRSSSPGMVVCHSARSARHGGHSLPLVLIMQGPAALHGAEIEANIVRSMQIRITSIHS